MKAPLFGLVLAAGLIGGCAAAPIAVRPSGEIGPPRVAVEDDRPGRPQPALIGDWYGSPIVLPGNLTAKQLVSDAVGKSYPQARVKLDVFWITSGNFKGDGPSPIVGHLRARVANGAKSTVLNATAQWKAARPTDADFRRVLDGLLGDVESPLAMMQMVKEL
jgi:hypothetical protein